MSIKTRALIIGMAGPAIQAAGILWTAVHLLVSHLHDPLTPRHIVFEPPFLVIVVGFLVTVVCLPVALEVAQATPEEVAIPLFQRAEEDETGPEGRAPALRGTD